MSGAPAAPPTDPHTARAHARRLAQALLFAARAPLSPADLARRLPPGTDVPALLAELAATHETGGFVLAEHGGRWSFATAADLAPALVHERADTRPLGRAAMETLAIIAYHEPATRAEVEEIRGVALSSDTLGTLVELGWVRAAGRRETPGRPLQYRTTPEFLHAHDLARLRDLPALADLRAAGLLSAEVPTIAPLPDDPQLPGV